MKRFKQIVLTILGVVVGLVLLVFILLNIPAVQNYAKNMIVDDLKSRLGNNVGIGDLHFTPFSFIELDSVYLYDESNEKVLLAKTISANIDLLDLITTQKIVINSATLSDFEIHLSKDSANAPLNIQYVIDAFKPKDDNKPKSNIEIKLNSIYLIDGQFTYDIKDRAAKNGMFDMNHIAVSDFNAKLSLKSLQSDSLNIQVKKFSLKEKSGLEIKDLVFRFLTQNKKMELKGFRLDLPSSFLEFETFKVDLTSAKDTGNIFKYADVNCVLLPSRISPHDISPLVPAFQYFKDAITLKGKVVGNIDKIEIDDLSIDYGSKMNLAINAEIRDIGDRDHMYILGSVDQLSITAQDAEKLIHNFSKNKISLPKQLSNLGTVTFQGDVSGYLHQLTAFGSFETKQGILKTDLLFGFNPKAGIASYLQGKIYTSGFDLGQTVDNKDFNKASLNLAVEIKKTVHGKLSGHAKGAVSDFDFKGYAYKDVALNVNYDGQRIDGLLNIDTPDGKLDISGLLDLADKNKLELNVRIDARNIEFDKLNIIEGFKQSNLSFVAKANFVGKNIDEAIGFISIDSLAFAREDKFFELNKFMVETSSSQDVKTLKITSDIINGEVSGVYSFSTLATSIQQTLRPYLSAVISPPSKRRPDDKENNIKFSFQINNTESLSNIFKLPVTVVSPAKIIGFYNNVQDKFKVEVFMPSAKVAGSNLNAGYVLAENTSTDIKAKIDALIIGKHGVTNDISILANVSDNLITTNISFANSGKQKARGDFAIATKLTKELSEPMQIDVDILPSSLLLNNETWSLDKTHIGYQDGIVNVDGFLAYNKDGSQQIKINGRYSKLSTTDILKAELKNINLEYIFQTLAIDVLKFGGFATGDVFLSSVGEKPYANTNLKVSEFKFNGTELGTLNLFSELDKETNQLILNGHILGLEHKKTTIDGFIDPIKQGLSINFDADSLNIGFLKTYTASIFNHLSGRGSGKVRLFGDFSNITVEGKAFVKDASVGISFLNTNYSFSDTIYMKPNLIYFNNVLFSDDQKNKAIGNGKVAHNMFADIMYHIDFSANNFLVYNVPESQNSLFFGKVFGSGKASIGGGEDAVDIDVSMRTEKNTTMRMNFMEDIVNEYSFITYKDNKAKTDSIDGNPKKTVVSAPIQSKSGMDVNMNFYVDATPDATVELVMDPVGGDLIRAIGSGAMQFTWSSKLAPRLYGTYTINRGSYNFTFQRIMERKFIIEDGSSVQFRGDPFEATLGVKAFYKVTANLNDLSKDLVTSTGQTTIPVNCLLNLSGPLKHPEVGLDLRFPTVDAEVERQIKHSINTEDMINRQVTYLLLLSKFYTPHGAEDSQQTSDFAAVASATLSSQLSKIVNQIDKRWELGTNIRTTSTDLSNSNTSTEVELMLSSRLLNDRLLINGNFGYRDGRNQAIPQEALIGDVDIELLLNNSGTWRLKAYNHYNEKYYYNSDNGSTQTQGVGIMYKKDFDGLKDLLITPKMRPMKLDTLKPILPDSTKKGGFLNNFIKHK